MVTKQNMVYDWCPSDFLYSDPKITIYPCMMQDHCNLPSTKNKIVLTLYYLQNKIRIWLSKLSKIQSQANQGPHHSTDPCLTSWRFLIVQERDVLAHLQAIVHPDPSDPSFLSTFSFICCIFSSCKALRGIFCILMIAFNVHSSVSPYHPAHGMHFKSV